MRGFIYLDADVVRRSLLIAAVATVTSVTLVNVTYLAIFGQDDRYLAAMSFSLIVPLLSAFPIGIVTMRQSKRLQILNEELHAEKQTTEALNHKLAYEASHDAMTGILNRKYFLEELDARSGCEEQDYVLLIDADHFKHINDHYGHHAGDQALVRICNLASSQLDSDDILGRVGGEEFAVLLKNRSISDAFSIAENIRQSIASEQFETEEGDRCELSVSIGVDQLVSEDERYPLRKVDIALYEAKMAGRNRTVVYKPSMNSRLGGQRSDRLRDRVA